MPPLVTCPACDRHVRSAETCPFCGALAPEAAPRGPARGLSRAAVIAAGAVVAACSGEVAQPVYGAPVPPEDAGASDAALDGDAELAQPVYGAPAPADAGADAVAGGADAADEGGMAQPLYGAAPMPPPEE